MTLIEKPDDTENYVTISPAGPKETLDGVDRFIVERLYKKYGAILFRGFDLDVDIFRNLTQAFCTHAVANPTLDRTFVDRENSIQTVDLGSVPFPLHPELSRAPWKPDVCWFACVMAPESGGETTICDGVSVVEDMPADVLEAFRSRRLRYTSKISENELHFWLNTRFPTHHQFRNPPKDCPFAFRMHGGEIYTSFTTPALHKPMFSDELAFGNFLLFARYLRNRLNRQFPVFEDGSVVPDELVESVKRISDNLATEIVWQENDVLMLDNTRFMHGRNEVLDVRQRYILTYFGYLKFAQPGGEEGENARWRKVDGMRGLEIKINQPRTTKPQPKTG